ncbi:uncharacterized protein LOC131847515 [Achroia grisella]|uniref:uncharacterized protein LOC131847515 n=1 Tax=Achroia grisella TaxID=688607 RepID=UPI0027D34A26|nr:uncharacterized protein LOC131847515 [Achroia grisella]
MLTRGQLAGLSPQPGASPGLMRRRYSVPETIMRKYRLAQQKSDTEESGRTRTPSPASASPPRGSCSSLCDTPHRFMRRDRELMRKSALLRRMWGRSCNPCQSCCCCSGDLCDSQTYCGRETRSLDGSRSELRHLSSSFTSSRQSHAAAAAGWATPKRLRHDSPRDFRGSDEMLRAAMRNSHDRAEESRFEMAVKTDQSSSTCQSYCHDVSPNTRNIETFSNGSAYKFEDSIEKNCSTRDTETLLSDPTTAEIESNSPKEIQFENESQTDTSESVTISMSTAKEMNGHIGQNICKQTSSSSAQIEGQFSERSLNIENDDNNILCYDTPLTVETPAYELLEIVVSETSNSNSVPAAKRCLPESILQPFKAPVQTNRTSENINIDEYVSNILVESLNSLTDQIECMNASIGSDRKVSIVEKEIKVKLQNTGVNTIVHLSPMSNNQIIFGNEELYNNEENKDKCINHRGLRDRVSFREEIQSVESNNNLTSSESFHQNMAAEGDLFSESNYNNSLQHDNVNKAVLQQIQKLFLDDNYSQKSIPEISHIEISNVDVYIDNNTDAVLESTNATDIPITKHLLDSELISNVGAGNYFQDSNDNIVIPRFSALPNTDSMEVNTSSSDDPDNIGSDCTSLVDSLDDPNSPRSVLLRRSFNNNRRNELARSAIDVLDLLPENSYTNQDNLNQAKESESFFIRIKDNDLDCEKENVVVADHMPEKIKQRLYRRHRKREMRLECARRCKVKQLKKDLEKQRQTDFCRSKRAVEKDCLAIINALIDDVISKIAQDEHKYMRIKQKCNKITTSKSDENVSKRNWKKDLEYYNNKNSSKAAKNRLQHADNMHDNKTEKQIHGKLSLLTHPPIASDDRGPRRFYQKSEIQDGNKCIEILEILEYVNDSNSSPDNTNSDDSQGNVSKNKKSRIPIPIYERIQKTPNNCNKNYKSNICTKITAQENNSKSNHLITNMLLEVLADSENGSNDVIHNNERLFSTENSARRSSVPHYEPRSRSNSLKFKRVFDIIPEERSSLSIDSSNEDIHYSRRASAPNLADELRPSYNKNNNRGTCNTETARLIDTIKYKDSQKCIKTSKENKYAGTSPFINSTEERNLKKKSQTTMTSPSQRSAATSPLKISTHSEATSTVTSSTASGPTTDATVGTKYNSQSSTDGRAGGTTDTIDEASAIAASGKRGLTSRSRAWLGFTQPEGKLPEEGLKEKNVVTDKTKDCRSVTTQYDREFDTHRTVRTIQTGIFDPIIVGGDKYKSKPLQNDTDTKRSKTKVNKNPSRAKSESRERTGTEPIDDNLNRTTDQIQKGNVTFRKTDKRKIRTISMERSEEETVRTKSVKLPEFKPSGTASSSDSSESGGSLLCSLAPKWLSTHARHKRSARRRDSAADTATPADSPPPAVAPGVDATGGWSVTVAGSCRAALPADVQMRLRFPAERDPPPTPPPPAHRQPPPPRHPLRTHRPGAAAGCNLHSQQCEEWRCQTPQSVACACTCCQHQHQHQHQHEHDHARAERRPPPLPPAQPPHPHLTHADSGRLTVTMKKEALGSSILATKSEKKSNDPLPDLETYRASRSKMKSSVKTRRGYSLHCWLPDDAPNLLKTSNGLSVLGSAIIPEMKPRVPTMSERDLTRVYTPRHYLRS